MEDKIVNPQVRFSSISSLCFALSFQSVLGDTQNILKPNHMLALGHHVISTCQFGVQLYFQSINIQSFIFNSEMKPQLVVVKS